MNDADAAARVIERLLVDASFRVQFRRDPAGACREAGLDALAEEMSLGAGKAMHTLDVRESRSSLAGVMMAAAFEGVGVLGFVEHIVPAVASAPGVVHDVLSRIDLKAIDSARGALAPEPAGGGAAAADPTAAGEAAAGGGGGASIPAAATAGTPAGDAPDTSAAGAHATAKDDPAAANGGRTSPKDGSASANGDPASTKTDPASHRDQGDAAGTGSSSDAEPPDSSKPHVPVDPAQYGAEGGGGRPDAEALALLHNKKVILDADGIADIKAGRIDPRIVAVLTKLSEKHTIQVSCMCSDHPTYTTGGSVSNHHFGRGMDIAAVDGMPVNAGNPVARDIATELGSLDEKYRPSEIGTPWQIADPRYFHDDDHNDHLHVGFDELIKANWRPPADVAAGGGGADDGGTGAAGGGGADDGGTGAAGGGDASAPRSTLALKLPAGASGGGAPKGHSLAMRAVVPDHTPRSQPSDSQPAGSSAAEQASAGAEDAHGAGPKAMAALKEALRYKGTPYKWGGSTPQTGFDCSGLVQWAYAKQGIRIPRVTDQQILAPNGKHIGRANLKPGDLIFFRDPTGYVHHVAISMGGDKFLHAPHTGDVVKESSLKESYYAQQFAGGRRFDQSAPGAAVDHKPDDVAAALAAHARDADAARNPQTLTFKALAKQEASKHGSTVRFLPAVHPDEGARPRDAGELADAPSGAPKGPTDYPGDNAPKPVIAAWMARKAEEAGLPRELPVMAALVESTLHNVQGGDRDSVGYFQMRVGIWNSGAYSGYPSDPDKQMKWFLDQALAVKKQRLARGESGFLKDDSQWGKWIADVERPQENLRYKYQDQLAMARKLLGHKY